MPLRVVWSIRIQCFSEVIPDAHQNLKKPRHYLNSSKGTDWDNREFTDSAENADRQDRPQGHYRRWDLWVDDAPVSCEQVRLGSEGHKVDLFLFCFRLDWSRLCNLWVSVTVCRELHCSLSSPAVAVGAGAILLHKPRIVLGYASRRMSHQSARVQSETMRTTQ